MVGDGDSLLALTDNLGRVQNKAHAVWSRLNPPLPLDEQVTALRTSIDRSVESGDLASASKLSIDLGELLEKLDDHGGAESACRQAVALARQVDAAMPEITLWAFRALVHFLPPSLETITLAREMATNLIERDDMYHPMRAADAAYCWATAELEFAEVSPERVDHAVNGVARQAVEMLDGVCFHDKGQIFRCRLVEWNVNMSLHTKAHAVFPPASDAKMPATHRKSADEHGHSPETEGRDGVSGKR